MNGGRIVPDGVLSGEEDPRRIFDHVVVLARIAGDDRSREDVVIAAGGSDGDERVGSAGPRISSPSVVKKYSKFYIRKLDPYLLILLSYEVEENCSL